MLARVKHQFGSLISSSGWTHWSHESGSGSAHRNVVIIYHLLAEEEEYKEFGATYFDERAREMVEKQLVKRLEGMGYQVILQKPG